MKGKRWAFIFVHAVFEGEPRPSPFRRSFCRLFQFLSTENIWNLKCFSYPSLRWFSISLPLILRSQI